MDAATSKALSAECRETLNQIVVLIEKAGSKRQLKRMKHLIAAEKSLTKALATED